MAAQGCHLDKAFPGKVQWPDNLKAGMKAQAAAIKVAWVRHGARISKWLENNGHSEDEAKAAVARKAPLAQQRMRRILKQPIVV
jgi:hypothetical protein